MSFVGEVRQAALKLRDAAGWAHAHEQALRCLRFLRCLRCLRHDSRLVHSDFNDEYKVDKNSVCVRARVCACVRVRACVCVCACAHVCVNI